MNEINGAVDAQSQKHAVIVAQFNDFITERLLDGALAALRKHGTQEENITVIRIPGAFEIGPTAKKAAQSGKFDAVTCLGAVIRGSTPHFDYVCSQAARLTAQASYDTGIPVIFGVLTTDTIEQAIERAGTKAGNKGYDAACAAIEMIHLFSKI